MPFIKFNDDFRDSLELTPTKYFFQGEHWILAWPSETWGGPYRRQIQYCSLGLCLKVGHKEQLLLEVGSHSNIINHLRKWRFWETLADRKYWNSKNASIGSHDWENQKVEQTENGKDKKIGGSVFKIEVLISDYESQKERTEKKMETVKTIYSMTTLRWSFRIEKINPWW